VLDVGCGPGIDTLVMSYRVCPGGQIVGIDYDAAMIRVVVADTDWATSSIDAPVERAFVRFIGDSLSNGYAGRQLSRLFNDHGLTGIGIEIWPTVWASYSRASRRSCATIRLRRPPS
jgi:SAM-dependent methyltransferase